VNKVGIMIPIYRAGPEILSWVWAANTGSVLKSLCVATEKQMMKCDWCHCEFVPGTAWGRFCSTSCHDRYHIDERRKAIAAYRAQQRVERSLSFFTDDLNDVTRNSQRRRA